MKIPIYISAFFLVVLFIFSCSKDSEPIVAPVDPIEEDIVTDTDNIETYNLIGDVTVPEGIVIDQRNGTIYTGGFGDGSIQRTLSGATEYFIEPGTESLLMNVLGLAIDESNQRLWVCSIIFGSPMVQVDVFSLNDATKLASFTQDDILEKIDNNIAPFVNDVTLDDAGNAYITNTNGNLIFTVPSDLSDIEILASDFPGSANYALNGIIVTPDEQYLIASSFISGTATTSALFRVSIADGSVELIMSTELGTTDFSTAGGDGLAFVDENTMLCASLANSILKVDFSENYTQGEISNITQGTAATTPIRGCATIDLYDQKVFTTNAQVATFLGSQNYILPFHIIEIPYSIIGL